MRTGRWARTVGSPQIRTAGTIGGNLATSSPAGDGLGPLCALDAVVEIVGPRGLRRVPYTDFATGLTGLLGHPQAVCEAFHITSDEALTWNQYFALTAAAAGVAAPRFVHIASDFLIACVPSVEGTLLGDKAVSAVFDNSKLKRLVPGFATHTRFADGIRRTLAWFEADPARQQIDVELNGRWDKLIAGYERATARAKAEFDTPA